MKHLFATVNMALILIGCINTGLDISEHSYGFAGFWVGIVIISTIGFSVMLAKEKVS